MPHFNFSDFTYNHASTAKESTVIKWFEALGYATEEWRFESMTGPMAEKHFLFTQQTSERFILITHVMSFHLERILMRHKFKFE